MNLRPLFSVLLVVFLCGCFQAKVHIPDIAPPHPHLAIPPETKLAPIRFSALQFAMDRGDIIGSRYSGLVGLQRCNLKGQGEVVWSTGRRYVGGQDDDYAQVFFETLSARGYNVVGDPKIMFGRSKELAKAKYLVGGRVLDLKMNLCDVYNMWDNPTGEEVAEIYLKVEWTVYSAVEKEVAYTTVTEGYHNRTEEIAGGINLTFMDALASAAEELASDQGMYDLVSKRPEPRSLANKPLPDEPIVLPQTLARVTPFEDNSEPLLNGVVTILLPGGHGSGFVISRDGWILTNEHVAGGHDTVMVRFRSGLELEGEVVREHKARDVALVKVQVNNVSSLCLRKTPVHVGEKVFAVGAPLDVDLSHTVTGGMVSAIRHFDDWMGGLETIQADVSIYGGNSGGPLVDVNGNVVGISEAGRLDDGANTNLNYFVPISDALKRLNVVIEKKKQDQ